MSSRAGSSVRRFVRGWTLTNTTSLTCSRTKRKISRSTSSSVDTTNSCTHVVSFVGGVVRTSHTNVKESCTIHKLLINRCSTVVGSNAFKKADNFLWADSGKWGISESTANEILPKTGDVWSRWPECRTGSMHHHKSLCRVYPAIPCQRQPSSRLLVFVPSSQIAQPVWKVVVCIPCIEHLSPNCWTAALLIAAVDTEGGSWFR